MTEYVSNSFAMFTEEGDKKVGEIVMSAILGECNWEWVENKLMVLGSEEATEDATDPAVREAVWSRLETVYSAKGIA